MERYPSKLPSVSNQQHQQSCSLLPDRKRGLLDSIECVIIPQLVNKLRKSNSPEGTCFDHELVSIAFKNKYHHDLDPGLVGYSSLADLLVNEFDDLIRLEIKKLPGKPRAATVVVPLVTDADSLLKRCLETQERVDAAAAAACQDQTHQDGARAAWGGINCPLPPPNNRSRSVAVPPHSSTSGQAMQAKGMASVEQGGLADDIPSHSGLQRGGAMEGTTGAAGGPALGWNDAGTSSCGLFPQSQLGDMMGLGLPSGMGLSLWQLRMMQLRQWGAMGGMLGPAWLQQQQQPLLQMWAGGNQVGSHGGGTTGSAGSGGMHLQGLEAGEGESSIAHHRRAGLKQKGKEQGGQEEQEEEGPGVTGSSDHLPVLKALENDHVGDEFLLGLEQGEEGVLGSGESHHTKCCSEGGPSPQLQGHQQKQLQQQQQGYAASRLSRGSCKGKPAAAGAGAVKQKGPAASQGSVSTHVVVVSGSQWDQDSQTAARGAGLLGELSPQDQMVRLKGLIRGKVKEAAYKGSQYHVHEVLLDYQASTRHRLSLLGWSSVQQLLENSQQELCIRLEQLPNGPVVLRLPQGEEEQGTAAMPVLAAGVRGKKQQQQGIGATMRSPDSIPGLGPRALLAAGAAGGRAGGMGAAGVTGACAAELARAGQDVIAAGAAAAAGEGGEKQGLKPGAACNTADGQTQAAVLELHQQVGAADEQPAAAGTANRATTAEQATGWCSGAAAGPYGGGTSDGQQSASTATTAAPSQAAISVVSFPMPQPVVYHHHPPLQSGPHPRPMFSRYAQQRPPPPRRDCVTWDLRQPAPPGAACSFGRPLVEVLLPSSMAPLLSSPGAQPAAGQDNPLLVSVPAGPAVLPPPVTAILPQPPVTAVLPQPPAAAVLPQPPPAAACNQVRLEVVLPPGVGIEAGLSMAAAAAQALAAGGQPQAAAAAQSAPAPSGMGAHPMYPLTQCPQPWGPASPPPAAAAADMPVLQPAGAAAAVQELGQRLQLTPTSAAPVAAAGDMGAADAPGSQAAGNVVGGADRQAAVHALAAGCVGVDVPAVRLGPADLSKQLIPQPQQQQQQTSEQQHAQQLQVEAVGKAARRELQDLRTSHRQHAVSHELQQQQQQPERPQRSQDPQPHQQQQPQKQQQQQVEAVEVIEIDMDEDAGEEGQAGGVVQEPKDNTQEAAGRKGQLPVGRRSKRLQQQEQQQKEQELQEGRQKEQVQHRKRKLQELKEQQENGMVEQSLDVILLQEQVLQQWAAKKEKQQKRQQKWQGSGGEGGLSGLPQLEQQHGQQDIVQQQQRHGQQGIVQQQQQQQQDGQQGIIQQQQQPHGQQGIVQKQQQQQQGNKRGTEQFPLLAKRWNEAQQLQQGKPLNTENLAQQPVYSESHWEEEQRLQPTEPLVLCPHTKQQHQEEDGKQEVKAMSNPLQKQQLIINQRRESAEQISGVHSGHREQGKGAAAAGGSIPCHEEFEDDDVFEDDKYEYDSGDPEAMQELDLLWQLPEAEEDEL